MRLNLGCGRDIKEGWMNIDMLPIRADNYIQWNLLNGFPDQLRDVTFIKSDHFWEHLTYNEGVELIRQSFIILNKGGVFRISLPKFKDSFKAYVEGNIDHFKDLWWVEPKTFLGYLNYAVYQNGEHKCLWDEEEIIRVLQMVGFQDCKVVPFDPSIDPTDPLRTKMSFYVEGTKV